MPELNLVQAVNDALRVEMRRDPRVVVLGEDVGQVRRRVPRHRGPARGVRRRPRDRHAARRGRHHRHRDRHGALRPAPGARDPVRRLHLSGVRSDRERAGEVPLPLGRRVPCPVVDPHAGRRRHPRRPLPLAVARGAVHPHRRGSRSSARRNPYDAKGLLLARDPRRRPGALHGAQAHLPRSRRARCPRATTRSPLGEAKVVREGRQVTRASRWGAMVHDGAGGGREGARRSGIDVEVIDLRTLVPFDIDAILTSVKKTGRVVIVHEAPRTCGFGAELVGVDPGARDRAPRGADRCA